MLKFNVKKIFSGMSKKKKLLLFLGIFVIAGAVIAGTVISNRSKSNLRQPHTVEETAVIERQTLTDSVSATGTIESAETKTVNTKLTNIKVVSVNVKEGDYVEEGTIICEFDASDYEAELAKAKNNYSVNRQIEALDEDYTTTYEKAVEAAEEGLQDVRDVRDAAKQEYLNAEEAENSAAADLSTKLDSLKAAKTAYETSQENEALTEEEKAALKDAFAAANADYEAAKDSYENARKAAQQAEAAYKQAQSQREDYQSSYEDALEKAQYDYDKAALEAQLIDESQEEKSISEYAELIDDCVVKASMSGVITSLNVTEGNMFEGGNIYTIQDNSQFIVSAAVDEYDISDIEKGMSAYIKTDTTGDTEMTGEVTYVAIAPSSSGSTMGAVSSSASYRIEVTINDPDENLRAGMTAKLSIALEESQDALTVPYDAVTGNRDGTSTITVDVDGEKKTIPVETGLETDYYTEIISDEISEGMTVYLNTPLAVSGGKDSREQIIPDMDNVYVFDGGSAPRQNSMPSDGGAGSHERGPSGF